MLNYWKNWGVRRPTHLIALDQRYKNTLDAHVSVNGQGMGIPAGRRLYPCPTHDLAGRVWVLPMGIKVCPYPWVKLPSLILNP
jgi:hypothetical protein